MNIWDFQRTLNRRLARINILNMIVGIFLSRRDGFWQAVGMQAIGWAFINLCIAFFGRIFTNQRYENIDDPNAPEIRHKEKRNLRNILLINACLNPLYIYGGARFAKYRIHSESGRGTGWGIMIQGAILAIFDTFHILKLMMRD